MGEKLHIIPHDYKVNRSLRSANLNQKPMLIWFTGLSGSGKSTLANALETDLSNQGFNTYLLDGDNVRTGLNSDLDFSEASRVENIRRIGEVANLMLDAGLVVLSAFVSPFAADRELVKQKVGAENYIEIFVSTSLEECERRDTKGLYAKARKGEISNFTGISSPFEAPTNPDMDIDTENVSVEEAVAQIGKLLIEKIKL
ncbi:MAG: adenylyl-sulfate kinase [Schleiferiaceae bacterium]